MARFAHNPPDNPVAATITTITDYDSPVGCTARDCIILLGFEPCYGELRNIARDWAALQALHNITRHDNAWDSAVLRGIAHNCEGLGRAARYWAAL